MIKKERIRQIFLAAGFTIKDGQTDLKDYVYDAAYALLDEAKEQKQVSQLVATYTNCRQQMIRRGDTILPRSCPKCGIAKYCPENGAVKTAN
jgi:hypothetical protein